MVKIERVRALEILDSRGNPTVAAEVRLSNGITASAKVPSGASTGKHEALELRDGDPSRYGGKGVLQAVRHIHEILGPAVCGCDPGDQPAIDRAMIALDGTPDKSRLGANAILGVSCAVARAAAMARGIPLWRHLQGERKACVPAPMVNILSGGLHAGGNFEFQDFMVIPQNYATLADSLEAIVHVHRAAYAILRERGCVLTGVADEGGWGPLLESNAAALDVLAAAIARAGARMKIAIDAASSHFYEPGVYRLGSERRTLSSIGMTDLLEDWVDRYRIASVEDGLAEDDWEGWRALTSRLGSRIQLVGDDLFATNLTRLERGIRERAANAVLVKMNQIGTLTETFAVIDRAREAGYGAVISARSGETEDDFLADLAVASGAGQIKIGSITRSERLAKYNRLLEIERDNVTSH
jgi:enolase